MALSTTTAIGIGEELGIHFCKNIFLYPNRWLPDRVEVLSVVQWLVDMNMSVALERATLRFCEFVQILVLSTSCLGSKAKAIR